MQIYFPRLEESGTHINIAGERIFKANYLAPDASKEGLKVRCQIVYNDDLEVNFFGASLTSGEMVLNMGIIFRWSTFLVRSVNTGLQPK